MCPQGLDGHNRGGVAGDDEESLFVYRADYFEEGFTVQDMSIE